MPSVMEVKNFHESVGLADRDPQEFVKSFDEINASITQIKSILTDIKNKINNGEVSTSKGISLLEVKNQMMISYLSNLMFVIVRKCLGKSINGDAAIERLVEIRTVLERIKPIEHKLKYQIDKMIKVAITGSADPNDPSKFRANPENLVNNVEGSEGESDDDAGNNDPDKNEGDEKRKSGIYVPPKLVAMHYDGDDTKADKQEKLLERARRHALNSSVIQDLREEYLDTPTEVVQSSTGRVRQSARMKERQDYEETYFTRLPTTKKDEHNSRSFITDGTVDSEVINFENISVLDSSRVRESSGKKRKLNSKNKSSKRKGSKNKKRKFH